MTLDVNRLAALAGITLVSTKHSPILNEAASKKNTPEKMAKDLLDNSPEVTFSELYRKADDLYGTPEGDALDATITILSKRTDVFKAKVAKLEADCRAIDMDLFDGNVAEQNCNYEEGMIDYAADYYRHCCNVVATTAEDKGIDINRELGYVIY